MSRERPVERCPECGSVYKMEYVGPPDDPHAHGHGDRKKSPYPILLTPTQLERYWLVERC